jgi:hypothetical protein
MSPTHKMDPFYKQRDKILLKKYTPHSHYNSYSTPSSSTTPPSHQHSPYFWTTMPGYSGYPFLDQSSLWLSFVTVKIFRVWQHQQHISHELPCHGFVYNLLVNNGQLLLHRIRPIKHFIISSRYFVC